MCAFVPLQNMTSAIRINLKGREPYGAVASAAEYEAVCQELTAQLLELENPETARSAVQWVRRARHIYRGPRLHHMPDLFVEWDHETPVRALRSPKIGTVNGSLSADLTGDDWKQGLLLARGPGFRPGPTGWIRAQDVAPTLLSLLDSPIPVAYEGQSALTMLRSPFATVLD